MLSGLEADRARVAELEARISHLERSLSALRIEKMLAQERLDSYKYPVLTLPNEIVSDIFMHFLPPYPLFPPLIGLLSPTLLTQICRKWREIALGTPALWKTISSYHESIHIPYDVVVQAFDIWLNRSRCCPLSLRINLSGGQLGVLAAMAPHRSRWEHLEVSSWPSHLAILDGPMPLLRYLDLRLFGSGTDTKVVTFEMPLLRTVVLNDAAALSVILPWAQLTSLTLLRVFPYECVPILQQTSSLVHCKLELFDSGDDELGGITLPCLESLTLVNPGRKLVIDFLKTLIVPALCSLEISEDFSAIQSLTAFISKSGCKLEEVHITGPRSVPASSYRKAFPSISRFSFSDEESSNSSDVEDDL